MLAGFERVRLAAGQHRELVFEVPGELLEQWDAAAGRGVVPPGTYEFAIGRSSTDLRAAATVKLS